MRQALSRVIRPPAASKSRINPVARMGARLELLIIQFVKQLAALPVAQCCRLFQSGVKVIGVAKQ
jgi:hypothetical protein